MPHAACGVIAALLLVTAAHAQTSITFVVSNGVTEAKISGATVAVDAWGASGTTDGNGIVTLVQPPGGASKVDVTVTASGFITFSREITVSSGSNFLSLSPLLDGGTDELRAILTWNLSPRDYDSHAIGSGYHVYYPSSSRTATFSNGGSVMLDLDDVDGYGPETITFRNLPQGWHTYYVYRFTSGGSVRTGDPVLQVYSSSKTTGAVGTYNTEGLSTSSSLRYWHVFDLNVVVDDSCTTITLYPRNTLSSSPPSTVQSTTASAGIVVYSSCDYDSCGVEPEEEERDPFTSTCTLVANEPAPALADLATNFDTVAATVANDYLGFDDATQLYQDEDLSTSVVDGEQRAETLANMMRDRLIPKADAVRAIREAVLASSAGSSVVTSCCTAPSSTTTVPRLGSLPIQLDDCARLPSYVPDQPSLWADTADIVPTLREVFENDAGVAFSYYGTSEGAYRIYPRTHQTDCGSYDARLRPWYVLAATPDPKDVIIVLDTSASMTTNNRIQLARDAAAAALATLSPRDHVSLITFSDTASAPSSSSINECLQSHMAPVTPSVVDQLDEYINTFVCPFGATAMGAALGLAFEIHEATTAQRQDDATLTVLLLSDGAPSEGYAYVEGVLNATTVPHTVFTYALGSELSADDLAFLQRIATSADHYEFLDESSPDIVSAMATFYETFAPDEWATKDATDVQFTVPYVDASGAGLVVTAALPVFEGTGDDVELKGVAGVDIAMTEVLDQVTPFEAAELSYVFAVDQDLRVFFHPNLAAPTQWDIQPTFRTLGSVEKTTVLSQLSDGILSGTPGSVAGQVHRSVPVGDNSNVAAVTEVMDVTYYWHAVEHTPFTLVVVIADDEQSVRHPSVATGAAASNFYHRLDLTSTRPPTLCRLDNNVVASRLEPTYRLAPRAFEEPLLYTSVTETSQCADGVQDAVAGGSVPNNCPAPNASAVRDIKITTRLAEVWKQTERNWILFRYVGTPAGVWTVLPGVPTFREYDPRDRVWYRTASAHTDSYTFSPPYVDAATNELVMTLSQAVLVPGLATPIAVVGLDFTIDRFGSLLDAAGAANARCGIGNQRCIVINNSGFLVYHPEFDGLTASTVEQQGIALSSLFVGEWEGALAEVLVDSGFLVRSFCLDPNSADSTRREGWSVRFDNTNTAMLDTNKVSVQGVAGDSLWLVGFTRSTSTHCSNNALCDCSVDFTEECYSCDSGVLHCHCPCTCPSDLNPCTGEGTDDELNVPVCPAPVPESQTQVAAGSGSGFERCVQPVTLREVTFVGAAWSRMSTQEKAVFRGQLPKDLAALSTNLTAVDFHILSIVSGSIVVQFETLTSSQAAQSELDAALEDDTATSFPLTLDAIPEAACDSQPCAISHEVTAQAVVTPGGGGGGNPGSDDDDSGATAAIVGAVVGVLVVGGITTCCCFYTYHKRSERKAAQQPATSTVVTSSAQPPAPAPAPQPQGYPPAGTQPQGFPTGAPQGYPPAQPQGYPPAQPQGYPPYNHANPPPAQPPYNPGAGYPPAGAPAAPGIGGGLYGPNPAGPYGAQPGGGAPMYGTGYPPPGQQAPAAASAPPAAADAPPAYHV